MISLRLYESVRREIKPNHRLADFVILGEAISRVLGNEANAFLEAWKQNTENQNLIVINNNTLAQLLIRYAFNERQELKFEIAPEELLTALKVFAINEGIDYDRSLPRDAVWLSRRINLISDDLIHAGLVIDADVRREHKRFIRFTKINKSGQTLSEGIKMHCN